MIETNIRIVEPGTKLCLRPRCAEIVTRDPSAKMLEKICNKFASQGLAAVYCSIRKHILVFARGAISPLEVKGDGWIVQVKDGSENQSIRFSHSENDASLLAQLIERHVLIEIRHRLPLQTINSQRIFYEAEPFQTEAGIDAYRRFNVSAIPIIGTGVGISVDVGVAFFTQLTLADFFQEGPLKHQQRLQKRFESLSQRQTGQKGTLIYDSGKNLISCYFDKFLSEITCATTTELFIKGEAYGSLLEYYQLKRPHLKIHADDCVAMVSFKGIDQPQPVAAKLLRLRVMNNSLPGKLKQVDKFSPKDRAELIKSFWERIGNDLLGNGQLRVSSHFWQPKSEKVINLFPPTLQFSSGITLPAPQERDYAAFREYYRQRLSLLDKVGCLDIPILMNRTVHFALYKGSREDMRVSLIRDITHRLGQFTQKPITSESVLYENLDEAFEKLNQDNNPGVVVFVFKDEAPEIYYKVAYELSNWRVKRITFRELNSKFDRFKSTINHSGSQPSAATQRGWNSFIEMTALDILQQLDCVPWGFENELPYDAHLAIDVGRDKRHFALSLLTFYPIPCIYTIVKPKTDARRETINGIVLGEKVVELCSKIVQRHDFQALRSLLVLRDGRESGNELQAIKTVTEELVRKKILVAGSSVDVVDFHKSSMRKPRLWERVRGKKIRQILEGEACFFDHRTVVLATTGDPTLHQGTAAPVMLVGQSDSIDMEHVAKSVYASTHLNFSNPNVAQRLPLELKRTDDELKNYDSQEIRRMR